ncbi:MAG: hypothetical protein IT289_02450 [Oligoflexia bacterium]|nr:hypothetical protein [Oligoflexia bacterium]
MKKILDRLIISSLLGLFLTFGQIAHGSLSCWDSLEDLSAQSTSDSLLLETSHSKRWPLINAHVAAMTKLSEIMKQMETGPEALLISDRDYFWEVIRAVVTEPERPLTALEYRSVAATKERLGIYETSLRARWVLSGLYAISKKVHHHWTAVESSWTLSSEPTLVGKLNLLFKAIFNGPIRFLAPVPLPRVATSTSKIFEKQWSDPAVNLEPAEKQALESYGVLERYQDRSNFLRGHNRWVKFRKFIQQSTRAVVLAAYLAAANHGVHLATTPQISGQQYLHSQVLRRNQVQIIVESVPFPHLAMRIGDRVYSYGVSHVTATPTTEYMMVNEIQKQLELRGLLATEPEVEPQHFTGKMKQSSVKASKPLTDRLGRLPRSVHVVTLELPPENVLRLKRQLEEAVAMRYTNITFVNDCATMVVRALENHSGFYVPPLIDALPSAIAMQLSMMKSFDHPAVKSIQLVMIDESTRTEYHLLRNTWINIMEAKLAVQFALYNIVTRAYLNIRYEPSELQKYDPEVVAAIMDMRKEVAQRVAEDQQIQVFQQRLIEIQRIRDLTLREQKRVLLVEGIRAYFDFELDKARGAVESLESDYISDVLYNQFKLEVLRAEKDRLLESVNKLSINQ